MLNIRRVIPVLLLAFYVAQCAWFIRTQSLTYDEPHHIKAGLEMWRLGKFEFLDGHPSLPRMWYALALLPDRFQIDQIEEQTATAILPSPEAVAQRARWMQVLLGVILGVLLWSAAKQLYSEGAANFALALFAFSPALIAHFSVATTDAAGVLMTFAAPFAVRRWQRRPASHPETLRLGVVLALLLLAKFYTQALFLLALFWVLTTNKNQGAANGLAFNWRPKQWNWRSAVGLFGICFILVWAAYFFHVSRITMNEQNVRLEIPGYGHAVGEELPFSARATIYLPGVEYLAGFGAALDHNNRGHRSYFLGEVSKTGGWKLYFPTVILLKWPTIVLAMFLPTLALAFMRRYPWPRDAIVLYSFPVLFLLPAVTSKINIGDRHILPVYPFVLLLVAGLWHALVAPGSAFRNPASAVRWTKICAIMLVLLAALMVADTLRVAPDYLSWFNIFVEPEESWRLLADSSNDWGQGLLALHEYQRQHPEEMIYLAYYGNAAPEVYGIRYVPLREGERVRGTVVISTVHLAGRLLQDPDAYKWLLQHKRKAFLNHSLYVFEVE